MLEALLRAIGVLTMDEQQRTLLSQKEAIKKAAERLLSVCDDIEKDFCNVPTWADVDKYWRALDLADAINDQL